MIAHEAAGGWQEAAVRIFCIDPVLYRPTVDLHVTLRQFELFARGNTDHLLDQVDARDRLGNGMFHLQASVHFEEVKAFARLVRARNNEFYRTRTVITNGLGQCDALFAHGLAHLRRDEGRRGFFDHLLVAALDRTFTFVEVDHIAVLVAEDLDFDVARVFDKFLYEDALIAEAVQSFALCRFEAILHILIVPREAHALAAAARAGLHHYRIADPVRPFERLCRIGDGAA